MSLVFSVGGSCINPDGKPDVKFIKEFCQVIKNRKEKIGILVGGGSIARAYATAARELGASEFEADEIAIASTRQNAMLLVQAIGKEAYPIVLTDFINAKKAATTHRIVVMGGTIPGITTDTDAVLLAEVIGAKKLINVSNVSGVYDSDPRKNPNAKKFTKMSYDQLIQLAMESDKRLAGTNFVFDLLTCKLLLRSKIEAHFVNNEIEEIKKAINNEKHNGTIVC